MLMSMLSLCVYYNLYGREGLAFGANKRYLT